MYQQQHRQQHNKRTLQLQNQQPLQQQQPSTPTQSIIRPQTRSQQQQIHHQQHNQQQQQQNQQQQQKQQLKQQHQHQHQHQHRHQPQTTSKESQILPCGIGDGQQLQLQHHQKPQQELSSPSPQQQPSSFDCRILSSMAYQHKHALHRLRRLKKRSPHRDLVISFVPRLRTSIINRLDFFNRYSKQEQEVLSCFDFLDELVLNYCDGGIESPRNSQKLYQSMIYEFI